MDDSLNDAAKRQGLRVRAAALLRPEWYSVSSVDLRTGDIDPARHFEEYGFIEDRSPTILFDPYWYRAQVGDVPDGVSAIEHYLVFGWRQGFDPHPCFDSSWYCRVLVDVLADVLADSSPLERYFRQGADQPGEPHPLFDGRWYVERHQIDLIDRTPLEHFLEVGWEQGLDPGPRFSTSAYLQANPDVQAMGCNPFVHYVTHGIMEGREYPVAVEDTGSAADDYDAETHSNPLDARAAAVLRSDWYLQRNPDVRYAGIDPAEHFQTYWGSADRDPCALFDSSWYRANFDVPNNVSAFRHYLTTGHLEGNWPGPVFHVEWYLRQATSIPVGLSPLEHYIKTGWCLGLDPHPLFSTSWYVDRSSSWSEASEITPFEHYLAVGWREGDDAGPLFSTAVYLAINPDIVRTGMNPLVHYLGFSNEEDRQASWILDRTWYVAEHADDPLLSRYGALGHLQRFGAADGWPASVDPLASALVIQRVEADQRARSYLRVGSPEPGGEFPTLWVDWDARARALSFGPPLHPRVSVVIPTLDHSEDVIRCLESVSAAGDSTSIELILVDDGSTPKHVERFESIVGLRLVRMPSNVGFADACIAGISAAGGEYLMLLNNDTEVLPGWIDALTAELDRDPTVGVVGAMIVQSNLVLQEAGAFVMADGTAHQYGNHDNPLDWRYRTRREVDYCSGAALLVRRSVWDETDGFDEQFKPAYYEDADLCFRARELGSKVVYQPGSTILHKEGTSHGVDGYGAKRLQFRHRSLFRLKWAMQLATHLTSAQPLTEEELLRCRDRRRNGHVLVIDHRPLTPDRDSGSVRMHRIIEDLVGRGLVVHFCSMHGAEEGSWRNAMQSLGVEVVNPDANCGPLMRALAPALEFVMVARPEVASTFLSALLTHAPMVPVAYDVVDAHALRLERKAAMRGMPELFEVAARFERLESSVARFADVVVTVSDEDEAFIRSIARSPLTMVRIPNVHLAEVVERPFAARNGLLFVGGFEHEPNVDAVLYLVHEVLPLITERVGPVQLTLAGSKPPPEVRRLAREGVDVLGWVPVLRPYYERARVVVAPLRFGAGVKGKIGEALSFGVPTVTTSIGVEGMNLQHGRDILVADAAADFAEAVTALYTDAARWSAQSSAGAAAIEAQFGQDATHRRITELIETLARVDPRRRSPRDRTGGLDAGDDRRRSTGEQWRERH